MVEIRLKNLRRSLFESPEGSIANTLGHVAMASMGLGTVSKVVDKGSDYVKKTKENNEKIQRILNKYDHFEAPDVRNKYSAIVTIEVKDLDSGKTTEKVIKHKGVVEADSAEEAKDILKAQYLSKLEDKNRVSSDANPKEEPRHNLEKSESLNEGQKHYSLKDIEVTPVDERTWTVNYYTSDGNEGSETIVSTNNKEDAIRAFKDKFKGKGYKVILKGTYISEDLKMKSISSDLLSLCEKANKSLKKPKSLNEDFDSYPPYLKRQILNNAKNQLDSVSNNPEITTDLPVLYNPALDPKDEEEIALDSFVTLFENTELLIKLIYTGLGSVVPVMERINNQDALRELKELFNYLIVTPVTEFDTVKTFQEILVNRYRTPLVDWNSQVKAINTTMVEFNLGSKITSIYDVLIDFFEYLKPLVQDICMDNEFDFTDIQLDLAKYLQTPFMDKNLGLDYLPELSAYVTV